RVLNEFEKNKEITLEKGDNVFMKLGVNKIPALLLDNTDRNRTSPFAFTGNKFEFRAVGGSANCAQPMTVLNTMVADQLFKFKADVDKLIEKGTKKELAISEVLQGYIKSSKKIIFEGNNYSEEWVKEAKKRGLANIKDTPTALEIYLRKENTELFEKHGIYSGKELHARVEIEWENYIKKVQIESRVLGDLAINHIVSTSLKYQTSLIQNVSGLKSIGIAAKIYQPTIDTIKKISDYTGKIITMVNQMTEARKKANTIEDAHKRALAYNQKVKVFFDQIRYQVDKLELIVDDDEWPLPKYRELLMVR
ncbi:MAG: glutamine synthetase type III, partial [Saprospiraceae bacterium]